MKAGILPAFLRATALLGGGTLRVPLPPTSRWSVQDRQKGHALRRGRPILDTTQPHSKPGMTASRCARPDGPGDQAQRWPAMHQRRTCATPRRRDLAR